MAFKRWNNVRVQYVDTVAVGHPPLNGGRLFFYSAGTSTKQNTYTDSTGATPNSNPVVLNSSGEPSTEIWLTVGSAYKVGLAIAGVDDPPASFLWTEDNILPINDASGFGLNSEWASFTAATPVFISPTSFSVVGSFVTTFEVGRRLKTVNSGGTIYSRITSSVFGGANTTVTVVNDSGVLDSGLSAVSFGILSVLNPSVPALNPASIGATTPGSGVFTTLSWGTGISNFGTITKRKTADQSVSTSAVLTNDVDLAFPIAANEEWILEAVIDSGAALTTTGSKVAINAPAGATLNAMALRANGSATDYSRTTTVGGAMDFGLASTSSNAQTRVSAWVLNGVTPGSVTLQWAGTNAAGTVTFRKGSFMQAVRVA